MEVINDPENGDPDDKLRNQLITLNEANISLNWIHCLNSMAYFKIF